MKKLLLSLLLGLVAIPASASLYNYYKEQGLSLPSISDRASLATECDISDYRGTYDQNIKLENCLRNNGDLTPQLAAALASSDLTQVVADFRSSLAQKLSVGGTTMTLQSVTDDDGVTLASGKYSFTLDGSSSNKEYVICDLNPSTKVCSNLVNISRQGVRTSGAVREHRVGAAITITDYTAIKYHNDILEGISSTTGGLLLGNGKISGLYNLDGTFTWLKYNTSTSQLQWSNNGSDYYDFTSSSITQLTASSTAGIGVTDSKIYIKASSTLGGAFDDSGNYYQKTTTGLSNGSSGIGIDYANNNTWTGTNIFSGTTTISSKPFKNNFGGTGVDGVLNITSGTTTIDLQNNKVVTKNYSSLNISNGVLNFSNSNGAGSIIILKVSGDAVISSTGSINITNLGATTTNGVGTFGTVGLGVNGASNNGGDSAVGMLPNAYVSSTFSKALIIGVGANGGFGHGSTSTSCGQSNIFGSCGRGAGAIYIEVGGNLTFNGTIIANGENGSLGTTDSVVSVVGGGGGGGGGTVVMLANSILQNTGTINVNGGNAGTAKNWSGCSSSEAMGGGSGGASSINSSSAAANGSSCSAANGTNGADGYYLVSVNTDF